jgi:hypothetical protein
LATGQGDVGAELCHLTALDDGQNIAFRNALAEIFTYRDYPAADRTADHRGMLRIGDYGGGCLHCPGKAGAHRAHLDVRGLHLFVGEFDEIGLLAIFFSASLCSADLPSSSFSFSSRFCEAPGVAAVVAEAWGLASSGLGGREHAARISSMPQTLKRNGTCIV